MRVGMKNYWVGVVTASQCCMNQFIIAIEVSVITTSPLSRNEDSLGKCLCKPSICRIY